MFIVAVGIDDLVVKPYIPYNEFVANLLRDNIGIVIFDLRGHGGQKHSSEAKKGMKELIYRKSI